MKSVLQSSRRRVALFETAANHANYCRQITFERSTYYEGCFIGAKFNLV